MSSIAKAIGPISYSQTSHNNVKLLRAGNEFFGKLLDLIEQAKHIIYFQIYIFEDDETGKQVADALMKAARRGVKIYMLVDGYASQSLPAEFIKNLQRSGIKFRKFEPIFRSKSYYFGRRLHHKIMVFDSCSALVGGINISNNYSDEFDKPAWLDWAVSVKGEAAAQLEEVCRIKAEKAGYRISVLKPARLKFKMPDEVCKVKISINDWINRKAEITQSYLRMFDEAQSYIYIMSPYFIPGRELTKALLASANRGVLIKLILPGISDVQMAKHAERYMYRKLFRHNIHIYEYQPKVLHGKLATYDGKWTTVGSYNVNNISAYASIELNIEIHNEVFAADVEKRLNRIIENDCIKLNEEDYLRKLNLFKLFVQRSSYDISRLLLFLFTFYFKQKE